MRYQLLILILQSREAHTLSYEVFVIPGAVISQRSDSRKLSHCIQDAGRKTPEKIISAEFIQDSSLKSLFNTLFMMFNSRYRGGIVHRISPPSSQRRIVRMYYILKER